VLWMVVGSAPNIITDTGVGPRFLEDDWTGAELAIGSEFLHAGACMPRHVRVNQAQHVVTANSNILRSLGAHHGSTLGLQAHARCFGTFRVGDVVTLRRVASR